MHVSLDSALGRQRRLNSVGESVLQIAPNAAAAYSLRSLTGGDPKVVRVRRGSDNAEQDFTASGISSGALVDFVNEDVTIYQSDYSADANGWSGSTSSPTGNHDGVSDSAGTSKDNVLKLVKQADSQGFTQRTQGVVAGLTYTVSGSFLAPASNTDVDGILVKDGVAGSSLSNYPSGYLTSNGTWTDFSFSYTATVKGLQRINMGSSSLGSNPNGSSTGSTGDIVYIADLKFVETTSNGFVETWYDQSGNNRPLIQTTASEQPLIVESGVFLNGVKANQATSNDTMQNLQVSTDGTNADFGTDDWASGASLKLGAVYVGTVPAASVATSSQNSIIWGGSRGVGAFQEGGVALSVIKAGTDNWRLRNERQGLSPSTMDVRVSLNTDADVVLYGTTDNREFTINVNGSGSTETESADLDVREGQALSLFGAYNGTDGRYYQRSSGGVCKECYLYAGDPVANIPALATSINAHYSIY